MRKADAIKRRKIGALERWLRARFLWTLRLNEQAVSERWTSGGRLQTGSYGDLLLNGGGRPHRDNSLIRHGFSAADANPRSSATQCVQHVVGLTVRCS